MGSRLYCGEYVFVLMARTSCAAWSNGHSTCHWNSNADGFLHRLPIMDLSPEGMQQAERLQFLQSGLPDPVN